MSVQRKISVAMMLFFFCISIGCAVNTVQKSVPAETALPKDKQTVLGLYATSKEAYERWKSDPTVKILDCRTPEEYIYVGHAAMAYNIPSKFTEYKLNEKKHPVMKDNPNFVAEVKRKFTSTDMIYITCRSGGRSAMSVNKLAEAGFKNVYTITDGFEGDDIKDPSSPLNGKRVKNGWKNSNLPWTYDLDPQLAYLPSGN
jgi:rhodanese-related sulfurtransferase